MSDRLARVLAAIDAANAADPKIEDGQPAARLYGERMSAMLAGSRPDAPELLKIAARGQHIARWTLPRADYPMTRPGYYAWRNAAKKMHAERVGALMAEAGYSGEEIAATLQAGVEYMQRMHRLVREQQAAHRRERARGITTRVVAALGLPPAMVNPLLMASVQAHIDADDGAME